ncbi:oligosaccharide flippase family protein [Bradyrhizobium ottawaense]|uniref:oligosaccharide flippase family protein n=1 Tax=Bradyrhizobium ottawaense TaxID=931866 RepID=UPI0038361077
MNSVQRSILFSAVDRYASLLVFFVTTAVLARLLTPEEFGIFAVLNAITVVIAACFQEFAGGSYLVQKRVLSRANVQTAFTITFGMSAVGAFVLFVLAQRVARLFELESLKEGIEVSALGLLILPFSGTIAALFRREMQFGTLAICSLSSGAVAAVISIVLALAHFSFMAPVWGGVAGNAVLALMLLVWRRDFGVLRLSLTESREIVRFGLYSGALNLINVFYGLAPQFFLAKILDFSSVGLYSRATTLTQVFDKFVTQVLNPVIMPAIVARSKSGSDLKFIYLDAIQRLSVVQWPFLIFVAVMARPIILIWLGPTWLEIVPLVQLLCISSLGLFAACLTYPMFVAVGRVQDALMSSLISLPPSLIVILGASFFGVHAVAASALLTVPYQAAVAIYFLGRHLGLTPREFARALWKSGAVTALTVAGVTVFCVLSATQSFTSIATLMLGSSAAVLCWWLGLVTTGHPLLQELYHAAISLARAAPGLRPSRPLASHPYLGAEHASESKRSTRSRGSDPASGPRQSLRLRDWG